MECYEEKGDLWYQNTVAINPDVIELAKNLEQEYDCAGMCRVPSFYVAKNISEGPPLNACIYKLKDSSDLSTGILGFAIATASFLLLMLHCATCGLYSEDTSAVRRLRPAGGLGGLGGAGSTTKKKFIFD